jgi:hypothetical protein
MKKIRLLLAATALVPVFLTTARAEKRDSTEVNRSAQAINFTQSIDASPWDRLSAQAVYSDGTPSSHSVTSGAYSTGTITIGSNPSGLIGAQASLTVNVKSITSITGESVTLNGIKFIAGTNFTVGATSITTAANLTAVIDAHPDFVATVAGTTVTVKYAVYGTSGNGLPASTSTAVNFSLSATTFSGGINRNTVTIDQTTLTEGADFAANASSQTTAINLSSAINANATLAAEVSASTTSLGVVTIKSKVIGITSYSIQTSSTPGFVISGLFPGGAVGEVSPTSDTITKATAHGFTTGLKVLLSTAGTNVAPTGLFGGTTYYAIKLNEYQYKLATSSTNAVAGTAVDITDITNGATMDAKPLALVTAAANGFYWDFSNDNVNFSTYTTAGTSVSSVTYSAAGNSVWDFGAFNYRYLRANFTGPTSGAIRLTIRIFGKKD